MNLTRRDFLIGSAALAAGASVSTPFFVPKYHWEQRPKRSRVAVLHAEQYSQQLDQILGEALRLFPINVRGKTVVFKPNLVDYLPGNAINTHPMLVLAAAEAFRRLGTESVVVAEGPGHQRDTQLVLSQSGYQESLRDEKIRFVDLNRDELIRAPLRRWSQRDGNLLRRDQQYLIAVIPTPSEAEAEEFASRLVPKSEEPPSAQGEAFLAPTGRPPCLLLRSFLGPWLQRIL